VKILFPAGSPNAPQKVVETVAQASVIPDIQLLRDALQTLKKEVNECREQSGTSIDALKKTVQALEERLSACEKLPVTAISVPAQAPVPREIPKKTANAELEKLRQSLSATVSPATGSIFSRFWTYLNESDAKGRSRRP